MAEILTEDIWSQVNQRLKVNQEKIASIAYVTTTGLDLVEGDVLICDASEGKIKSGATSPKVLNEYFEKGVKIFSHTSLHTKVLWTSNFVVIGSSNLSVNSAEKLAEIAVLSDDDQLISQMESYLHDLKKISIELDLDDLKYLDQIPVNEKRFSTDKSVARVDKIGTKLGGRYWIVSVYDLSPKIVEAEKKHTSKVVARLGEVYNVKGDHISYIRISTRKRIAREVCKGDQVIKIWPESKGKNAKVRVYPFRTILDVQMSEGGKWARLYYDSRDMQEEKKIYWSGFSRQAVKIITPEIKKNSTRELPKEAAIRLKSIWQE